jgi:nucleoside-diphosphate-sugar epimerase
MIYVTGITGHSGRWFLERLKREGCRDKIRCTVRPQSATKDLLDSGLDIEPVVGDLSDVDFLRRTMAGAETVVHITEIGFSPKIVEAAHACGVGWAILVHTTGMFSRFKSASAQYLAIEESVLPNRDQGLAITVLRPPMIYGSSRDRHMYKLVAYLDTHRFFPIFGGGRNLMQPVNARDLGNAYYDVLRNGERTRNREYNLSGGDAVPYIDLCRTISAQLGRRTIFVRVPLSLSLLAAWAYNLVRRNAIISVEQVLRMKEDKVFDHGAATRDFGYRPMSFREGIAMEVAEYKNEGLRND